jgi:glyoxylase-like metal-dependent hydrolase (beta-lactamase superfamily II)
MRRMTVAVLGLLAMVSVPALQQSANAQRGSAPDYSIEAIRISTQKNYPLSMLLKGAPEKQLIDIPGNFYLIRGGGHIYLFDSGFHPSNPGAQYFWGDYISPREALQQAGVDPDKVTDIIISHVHGDHMGGLDFFPNAMFWIQRGEYEYYTTDVWQPGGKEKPNPDQMIELVRQNMRGHLHLINGDAVEILPGITVYTGTRHTFASQYIRVAGNPPYVLASDNCPLYENLKSHRVPSHMFDLAEEPAQLAALDRMAALAGSADRVVPGHDMLIYQRFPTKGRVARIR